MLPKEMLGMWFSQGISKERRIAMESKCHCKRWLDRQIGLHMYKEKGTGFFMISLSTHSLIYSTM